MKKSCVLVSGGAGYIGSHTAVELIGAGYDVVIVGGGASGTAAGLQAARMGARTLIVEEFDWLGGMLTNFATIRTRVKRMEELEAMDADGRMALLPKKEQILLHKELAKLQTNLNGIRNMKKAPDAIFVIDTNREGIALHEAHRLEIPVVGTLDTNCDPDDVDYGIPANDDAIRSVRLLADFMADAVIAGRNDSLEEVVEAAKDEEFVEVAAEETPAA